MKHLATGMLGLILAAGAPIAHASVISGTFLGTATGGSFSVPGGTSVDVAGTPINGSFDLASIASATSASAALGPNSYFLPSGAVTLTFNIVALNQTTTFSASPSGHSAIELSDTGTTQSLTLIPSFLDPHQFTNLGLTGPEGSLFSSITDLTTLHAGPGVTIQPIALSVYFQGSAGVVVNSVTFATPVDEPPAWAVLVPSLAALFGTLALARIRRPTGSYA